MTYMIKNTMAPAGAITIAGVELLAGAEADLHIDLEPSGLLDAIVEDGTTAKTLAEALADGTCELTAETLEARPGSAPAPATPGQTLAQQAAIPIPASLPVAARVWAKLTEAPIEDGGTVNYEIKLRGVIVEGQNRDAINIGALGSATRDGSVDAPRPFQSGGSSRSRLEVRGGAGVVEFWIRLSLTGSATFEASSKLEVSP